MKITSMAEIPLPETVRDLITSLGELPPDAKVTFGERVTHPWGSIGIMVQWQEER